MNAREKNNYISTRGLSPSCTSGQAIERGIAPDGGLYVPEEIPSFDRPLTELCKLNYTELAYAVLKLYLPDIEDGELKKAINEAYSFPANFDNTHIAPLASCSADGFCFLELFHGRTQAFKDMALSLLPALLTGAAKRERPGVKSIILTATSGDTGKAALASFADVPDVDVVVFYPENGVSEIQKLQMTTQEGANTHVIGVRGNFDDAQTGVKKIFNDNALAEKLCESNAAFSSANSINIGRLLPQIVYYVYAYAQLCNSGAVKPGGAVDFAVPTGNFGNILAGYYAKRMGLPVGKLICASNSNNVLHEFFQTGVYDARRAFHVTQSPSMDILVSSNLERLLYHVSNDAAKVRALMEGLSNDGRYDFKIPGGEFESAFADESETSQAIKEVYRLGYLCDPHTAVAYHAAKLHKRTGVPVVVLATASPYKFAPSVAEAVGARSESDPFAQMRALSEASGASIPPALINLREKPIRHTAVCDIGDMKNAVASIIF